MAIPPAEERRDSVEKMRPELEASPPYNEREVRFGPRDLSNANRNSFHWSNAGVRTQELIDTPLLSTLIPNYSRQSSESSSQSGPRPERRDTSRRCRPSPYPPAEPPLNMNPQEADGQPFPTHLSGYNMSRPENSGLTQPNGGYQYFSGSHTTSSMDSPTQPYQNNGPGQAAPYLPRTAHPGPPYPLVGGIQPLGEGRWSSYQGAETGQHQPAASVAMSITAVVEQNGYSEEEESPGALVSGNESECQLCGKTLADIHLLNRHTHSVHRDTVENCYRCPIGRHSKCAADKIFRRRDNLRDHIKRIHGEVQEEQMTTYLNDGKIL